MLNVSVNKQSSVKVELTITTPYSEVQAEEAKHLKEISPKVKLPGFRAGKIPKDVIIQNYGKEIHSEAIRKIISETYPKALEQEKVNPVSMPAINIVKDDQENGLQYTATVEVLPDFAIPDLSTATVEKPVAEITEEDIESEITKVKKHHVNFEKPADPNYVAKTGDKMVINLTIKSLEDGKEKVEEGVNFELGSGMMWSEFEKPLLGAKCGAELTYPLSFPATHIEPDFAGKAVEAKVKVLELLEAKMPSEEEFVKKVGFENKGGFAAFKEELTQSMKRELKKALTSKYDANVISKLIEAIPLEIPQSLVDSEMEHRRDEMVRRLQTLTKSKKVPPFNKEYFAAEATRAVTAGIILSKVIKDNNLVATSEKVQQKISELAENADKSRKDEIIRMYQADPNAMKNVENLLLEEEALNLIKQKMQTTEKQLKFSEALER